MHLQLDSRPRPHHVILHCPPADEPRQARRGPPRGRQSSWPAGYCKPPLRAAAAAAWVGRPQKEAELYDMCQLRKRVANDKVEAPPPPLARLAWASVESSGRRLPPPATSVYVLYICTPEQQPGEAAKGVGRQGRVIVGRLTHTEPWAD
ncbi:hypothetical protein CDD83_10890 [Cordyceps sp. RAO-2017]|nr:hypothetical protein CDD83_10890 [Cordyceps sp. RAO-2017]